MDMKKIFSITLLLCIAVTLSQSMQTRAAATPTVDTITAAQTSGGSESSFNLTENATTTLYVHGTITDTDGCEDVAVNGTVTGKFYRTNVAGADLCSTDNNQCYSINNANCTKTGCSGPGDNTFNYECTKQIQYYADSTTLGGFSATDWTAKITATDQATTTGSATDAIEMNTLVALDIPANVSYGSIALDTVSSEQTLVVTNTGNSALDIQVQVDGAMACDGQGSQNVPGGHAHYSMTSGFIWGSGTALSTTLTEVEFNLAPRIDEVNPRTKDLYLKLKMPVSGIRGSCTNTLTVQAKGDNENGW